MTDKNLYQGFITFRRPESGEVHSNYFHIDGKDVFDFYVG